MATVSNVFYWMGDIHLHIGRYLLAFRWASIFFSPSICHRQIHLHELQVKSLHQNHDRGQT